MGSWDKETVRKVLCEAAAEVQPFILGDGTNRNMMIGFDRLYAVVVTAAKNSDYYDQHALAAEALGVLRKATEYANDASRTTRDALTVWLSSRMPSEVRDAMLHAARSLDTEASSAA